MFYFIKNQTILVTVVFKYWLLLNFWRVCISNHISGRAIRDKLPKCIFENFEIARVKREQFQNFQKLRWWFIPKIVCTNHVITSKSHQTSKHFVLKLISNIFKQRAITNQRSGNYKIPPLTVQCRLQSIVFSNRRSLKFATISKVFCVQNSGCTVLVNIYTA